MNRILQFWQRITGAESARLNKQIETQSTALLLAAQRESELWKELNYFRMADRGNGATRNPQVVFEMRAAMAQAIDDSTHDLWERRRQEVPKP